MSKKIENAILNAIPEPIQDGMNTATIRMSQLELIYLTFKHNQ